MESLRLDVISDAFARIAAPVQNVVNIDTPAATASVVRAVARIVLVGFLAAMMQIANASTAAAQTDIWSYAVQLDENPWSITRKYLSDGLYYWRALVRRNDIKKPRYIPPGTIITIPARWLRISPSEAEIIRISGDVILVAPRGSRAAAESDKIVGGETIETAARSSALVRLANGTRLLVPANSKLRFDRLSGYENTLMVDASIRLFEGRVETIVERAGSLDQLEVRTPVTVSVVRGTQFRLGTTADGDRIEVISGRVDLSATDRTVAVAAGQGALARMGQPLEPPRQLLPAPRIQPGSALVERLPLAIEIVPLEGATAYRAQIAPNSNFNQLLFDRVFPGPLLTVGELADDEYALRVRGIDSDGIEGRDLKTSIIVNARPSPPFLIEPQIDGKNRTERPTFRWAEVDGATGYRFELTRGTVVEFERDLPAKGIFEVPDELAPDTYHWRVATLDDDRERGPFSDLQTFQQLPPTPTVDTPPTAERTDDGIVIRWVDAGPQYRYRVQVARDLAQSDLIQDRVLETNSLRFGPLMGGPIYVRVAVIEPDGYQGSFGAVNRVDLPPLDWWPMSIVPFAIILLL